MIVPDCVATISVLFSTMHHEHEEVEQKTLHQISAESLAL